MNPAKCAHCEMRFDSDQTANWAGDCENHRALEMRCRLCGEVTRWGIERRKGCCIHVLISPAEAYLVIAAIIVALVLVSASVGFLTGGG